MRRNLSSTPPPPQSPNRHFNTKQHGVRQATTYMQEKILIYFFPKLQLCYEGETGDGTTLFPKTIMAFREVMHQANTVFSLSSGDFWAFHNNLFKQRQRLTLSDYVRMGYITFVLKFISFCIPLVNGLEIKLQFHMHYLTVCTSVISRKVEILNGMIRSLDWNVSVISSFLCCWKTIHYQALACLLDQGSATQVTVTNLCSTHLKNYCVCPLCFI